ncbi:MAG: hydrogenase iron-sulfur subunit [Candidatus Schekmanbacteria bacterium]|nr:hydrogenase iron-sulfur subunit [Candidatus Schekmanbacteria bacterium]
MKSVKRQEKQETENKAGAALPQNAVFLCSCAGEIDKVINPERVLKALESSGKFANIYRHDSLCQPNGIRAIADSVKDSGTEKFLIAACSPQSIGKIFKEGLERAGIDTSRYSIVNIREGCAWPHANEPELATEKSISMIKTAWMGLKSSVEKDTEVRGINESAIVIGGGPAGISAAFELAESGIKTTIIEKKHVLGGFANKLGIVAPTNDCALCTAFLDTGNLEVCRKCIYRSRIDSQSNLKIVTKGKVTGISGEPGNFTVKVAKEPRYVDVDKCILCGKCEDVCPVTGIKSKPYSTVTRKAAFLPYPQAIPRAYVIDREACKEGCTECEKICPTRAIDLNEQKTEQTLNAGAVVIATGIKEYKPNEITELGYGRYPNVITQHQLGNMLNPEGHTAGEVIRPSDGRKPKNIVMMQCVGSRDKYHPYCSEVCCLFATKHAILLRERAGAEVTICYIDIRTPGFFEKYYVEARDKWVNFIKGRPSSIEEDPDTKNLYVTVEDMAINSDVVLNADLMVLSSALIPSEDTEELSKVSGIELNEYGFIKEYYGKNRANETSLKGIYVAGSATGPKNIPLSVSQGSAAAAKAISQIKRLKAKKEILCASIDEELCIKCGICVKICPVKAIETEESLTALDILETPEVNRIKCLNCGQCSAYCPTGAIWAGNYSGENFFPQIEEILAGNTIKPKILTFLCLECAYAAVDLAGLKKISYPANIIPLGVPCAGKVSLVDILKAFECGAEGVLLGGCVTCHFKNGKDFMVSQAVFGKELLASIGIEPERLDYFTAAISDHAKFLDIARGMTQKLKKL